MRVFGFLVGLFVLMSSFQNDEGNAFVARFLEKSKTNTSIAASFTQEKNMAVLQKPVMSRGEFSFYKPNNLKWVQTSPSRYAFTLHKNEVTIVTETSTKTLSADNPQVSFFKNFVLKTVDGSIFESEEFETSFHLNGDKMEVTLLPKAKQVKKRIQSLWLQFDNKNCMLLALKMNEAKGDYTLITFSNHKLNSLTNTSIFE